MSNGWKKWECPPDMLTVEEKLKTLQLTERQLDEISLTYFDAEMNRAKTPEQKQAWANLSVRKRSKLIKANLQENLVEDFQLWLQGRSKYNVKTIEEVKYNPISEKFEKMKRECTPWGNKTLLHLPDVCEWLKLPLLNRDKVAKGISVLKMTTPTDIDACWIYYKYIVRGVGIDGNILKEQRNYNVFDYIEKRPQKAEYNGIDGTYVLVDDDRFTPYSMDNPSMPRFDEKSYQDNFKKFSRGVQEGNLGMLVDESEKFSMLTPDDKLLILLQAGAHAELHAPVFGVAPIGDPVAAPAKIPLDTKLNAWYMAEFAGTLGAALQQNAKDISAATQKATQPVLNEILKTQKKTEEAIAALAKIEKDARKDFEKRPVAPGKVVIEEFAEMVDLLKKMREDHIDGKKANYEMMRAFKDQNKIIDKLITRGNPPKPPQIPPKPVIVIKEKPKLALVHEKPEVVLAEEPKPEVPPVPVAKEIVPEIEKPDDIIPPSPVKITDEYLASIGAAPIAPVAVTAPEPVPEIVPAPAEGVAMEGTPEEFIEPYMWPRLEDSFKQTNNMYRQLASNDKDAADVVTSGLNRAIRDKQVFEILKQSNKLVPTMKSVAVEQLSQRLIDETDRVKSAFEKSILLRDLAFRVPVLDGQLHERYIKNIYEVATGEDVNTKLASLREIHAYLVKVDGLNGVKGFLSLDQMRQNIDDVLKKAYKTFDLSAPLEDRDRIGNYLIENLKNRVEDPKVFGKLLEYEEEYEQNKRYGLEGKELLRMVETMQGELGQKTEYATQLENKLAILQHRLEHPDTTFVDNLSKRLEELTGQKQALEEEKENILENLRTNLDKYNAYKESAEMRNEQLNTELAIEQRKAKEIQERLNALSESGEINQNLVNKYVEERNLAIRTADAIKDTMEQNRVHLENQKLEIQGALRLEQQKVNQLEEHFAHSQRQLNFFQTQYNIKVSEQQQMKQHFEGEQEQLKRQIENLDKKIGTLQNSELYVAYQQALLQRTQLEERVKGMENEHSVRIEGFSREIEDLKRRNVEGEEKKKWLEGQNEATRQQLQTAQLEKQKHELQMEELRKTITSLQDKVVEAQKSAGENAEMEVEQLNGELKEARGELELKTTEWNRLRNEINEREKGFKSTLAKKTEEYEKYKQQSEIEKRQLRHDLELKIKQVNSITKGEKDTKKTQTLKMEVENLRARLAESEKRYQEQSELHKRQLNKAETDLKVQKSKTKELSAKKESTGKRVGLLQRMLEGGAQALNTTGRLASRLIHSMEYMANNALSENLEHMYIHKDDSNAVVRTKAEEALIKASAQLAKSRRINNKQLKTIEKQRIKLEEYERALANYKEKSAKTVETYEKIIADPEALKAQPDLYKEMNPKTAFSFGSKRPAPALQSLGIAQKFTQHANELGKAATQVQALANKSKTALADPAKLGDIQNLRKTFSANYSEGLTQLSKLETEKLNLYSKIDELREFMGRAMNQKQMDDMGRLEAGLERGVALLDREINGLQNSLNRMNTNLSLINSLVEGTSKKASDRVDFRQARIEFDEIRGGSLAVAKNAASRFVDMLEDAVAADRNFLYLADDDQFDQFIEIMHHIYNKIEDSDQANDPDTQKLKMRFRNTWEAMSDVWKMPREQKDRIVANSFARAHEMQKEIAQEEAEKGSIMDVEDREVPEIDIMNQENAEFAPSQEEQLKQKARVFASLTTLGNGGKLTEEEVEGIRKYVDIYGHKSLSQQTLAALRTSVLQKLEDIAENPEKALEGNAIQELAADKNDLVTTEHILRYISGVVREVMPEFVTMIDDDSGELKKPITRPTTSEEKKSLKRWKISQALRKASPEVVNQILNSELFNIFGPSSKVGLDVDKVLAGETYHDLLESRFEFAKQLDTMDKKLEYLTRTFENYTQQDYALVESFANDLDTALGLKGNLSKADLNKPMNYLIRHGEVENAANIAASETGTTVYGMEKDSLETVLNQVPGTEAREKIAYILKAFYDTATEGKVYPSSEYVNGITTLKQELQKTLAAKLIKNGQSTDLYMFTKPTPDIKHFMDNSKQFLNLGKAITETKYEDNPARQARLAKAFKGMSQALLLDAGKALREVDLLSLTASIADKSKQYNSLNKQTINQVEFRQQRLAVLEKKRLEREARKRAENMQAVAKRQASVI